jgi:hypothetical protein
MHIKLTATPTDGCQRVISHALETINRNPPEGSRPFMLAREREDGSVSIETASCCAHGLPLIVALGLDEDAMRSISVADGIADKVGAIGAPGERYGLLLSVDVLGNMQVGMMLIRADAGLSVGINANGSAALS